jgi:predicted aspartyl protease
MIVDAVVVGPSGQAAVRLVLDTGATLTTLVPRIAESIGYTSAARVARSVIRAAVAEEHGYIVRLVKLSILGFTVPDAHADVADLGHGSDAQGGAKSRRARRLSPRVCRS